MQTQYQQYNQQVSTTKKTPVLAIIASVFLGLGFFSKMMLGIIFKIYIETPDYQQTIIDSCSMQKECNPAVSAQVDIFFQRMLIFLFISALISLVLLILTIVAIKKNNASTRIIYLIVGLIALTFGNLVTAILLVVQYFNSNKAEKVQQESQNIYYY